MTNAVMILPASYLDAANAFGIEQGWGEGNFSVPLSATGAEPVTHWGCCADVTEGFLAIMAEPPTEAIPLLETMISSFEDNVQPYDHWVATLELNGLQRVTQNEEI